MVVEIRTRAMSRHPLELALVIALAISAGFQITQGAASGTLSAMLPTLPRLALSYVIIVGAVLTIVGAAFHPKSEPLALHAELAGVLSIGLSMSAYLSLIIMRVPEWPQTSSVWTTGGIAAGFLIRGLQIGLLIRKLICLTRQLDALGIGRRRNR